MDKKLCIITLFSDAEKESELASQLHRNGYALTARTFTLNTALIVLNDLNDENAILFVEKAFMDMYPRSESQLRARTKKVHSVSGVVSDNELIALFKEGISQVLSDLYLPESQIPTIAFASPTRLQGVSTIARACAVELANRGFETLLIDAHSQSPSLAERLGIFGLKKQAHQIDHRLHVAEFNPDVEGSADAVLEAGRRAQRIVVDLGEITSLKHSFHGKRRHDRVITSSAMKMSRLALISDSFHAERSRALAQQLNSLHFAADIHVITNFASLKGSGQSHTHFMRDQRLTESHHSGIALPHRAVMRREIARYVDSYPLG